MNRSIFLTLCLGSILPVAVCAQQRNDSVPGKEGTGLSQEEIQELTRPIGTTPLSGELKTDGSTRLSEDIPVNPAFEQQAPTVPDMHIQLWPKGSRLPQWATGMMYGYNRRGVSPFFGYSAHAGMGVYQQLAKYWTLQGGVGLNKYSVDFVTAMFDGSVNWHPNPYFGVTMFGSYTTPGFGGPLSVGQSFQWGGYITLQSDTDVPFGLDAGMRTGYDPLTGHWNTPIVQPFVKIGDAKLGIDVGPMIQNALRKEAGHDGVGNPVPKPIKNLPQVAPRR
jgi:hypothetical protein